MRLSESQAVLHDCFRMDHCADGSHGTSVLSMQHHQDGTEPRLSIKLIGCRCQTGLIVLMLLLHIVCLWRQLRPGGQEHQTGDDRKETLFHTSCIAGCPQAQINASQFHNSSTAEDLSHSCCGMFPNSYQHLKVPQQFHDRRPITLSLRPTPSPSWTALP